MTIIQVLAIPDYLAFDSEDESQEQYEFREKLNTSKVWVDTVWEDVLTARENFPDETYRVIEVVG